MEHCYNIKIFIFLCRKFLQFDWLRAVVFQLNLKYTYMYMWKLQTFSGYEYKQIIASFVCDILHEFHLWDFKIVSNFTGLRACEILYNNFEIPLVVFMPNITTNHAITYTNSCIIIIKMLPRTRMCKEMRDGTDSTCEQPN